MKLSKTEEQLMHHIWQLKKAYMKELIQAYENPKPATTTSATLLSRMKDKGYIDYNVNGKTRQYYPLVSKDSYFKKHFSTLLSSFFGNSATQFASFFTKSTDLTQSELESLRSIIDREIEKKKEAK